jgi:hypothetical protein
MLETVLVFVQKNITPLSAFLGVILGAFLNNWGSTKRLNLQLNHDANERKKERLAILRRELFLKAAAANSQMIGLLSNFPKADLDNFDSDSRVRELLSVCAQLQLIVRVDTARIISDFGTACTELVMKLTPKIVPMKTLAFEIKFLNSRYDEVTAETKRVLAAMAHHNEIGVKDRDAFDRLNRAFSNSQEISQKIVDDRGNAENKLLALQREYAKNLFKELKHVNELEIKVLVALRNELEVEGGVSDFTEMANNQLMRIMKAYDEFEQKIYEDVPKAICNEPN